MIKRLFDLLIVVVGAFILALPFVVIMLLVKVTSVGPIFYWSKRVGRNSKYFMMPKFRTMRVDTPEVATDALKDPEQYVTFVGAFLRKTSLDELPQLMSVFKGDMSIVGPRPALHTQAALIEKRRVIGIDVLLPGITGWAQINGRDEIDIERKLTLDKEYLESHNLCLDIKIILLTVVAVTGARGIKH